MHILTGHLQYGKKTTSMVVLFSLIVLFQILIFQIPNSDAQSATLIPCHQLLWTSYHYTTATESDKDLKISEGFTYLRVLCNILPSEVNYDGQRSVPLYLLSKGFTSILTISESDRDFYIQTEGFTDKGITGYVFASSVQDSIGIYELYRPANLGGLSYPYVNSFAEADDATNHNYQNMGIKWYAFPDSMGTLSGAVEIDPQISVSANPKYGEVATVTGIAFPGNVNVSILIDGSTVSTTTTDGAGSFSSSFTVDTLPGLYTLEVNDEEGNSKSLPVNIIAPDPATISFAANPTSGDIPLSVSFTGTISGGVPPYSYELDPGDGTGVQSGTSSGTINLNHEYSTDGSFTATLSVTDSLSNTQQKTYTISANSVFVPPPSPVSVTFSRNPTSGQAPLLVTFTGLASGGTSPYSYELDFGDGSSKKTGSTSGSISQTYTYNAGGTFSPKLLVTDNDGVSKSVGTTIQVSVPAIIPPPPPTPIPTPEPTPIPTPEPTPIPTPEPIPQPKNKEVIVSIPPGSGVRGCEDTNSCYLPYTTRINVGETITWNNEDSSPHTATSGIPLQGPDRKFDTSIMTSGNSASHTFETEGTYPYFCRIHPWEEGKIIVGDLEPISASTDDDSGESVISVESTDQQPSTTQTGGGCLIATATYGSELAPQVQKLRELRDNILLQTHSGSAFMNGFNELYYTFSPTIADWERQNTIFKETVKLTITPLITTLSVLNYVSLDSEIEVLGYGIGLIMLNVGIYFVTPAWGLKKLFSKTRDWCKRKP